MQGSSAAPAPTGGPIPRDIPSVIANGAPVVGAHAAGDVLRVNVGLAVRDSAGLDAVIRAAGTPGSPSYGKYLSRAQYLATYAPDSSAVGSVEEWLKSQGLTVLGAAPDNLYVRAQGTTRLVASAFRVAVNDYKVAGRTAFSNDRPPTAPDTLGVTWVSGLNDVWTVKASHHARRTADADPTTGLPCGAYPGLSVPCYFPSSFRSAYDVPSTWTASGQTIGMTLWFAPLHQSDLTTFAAQTGSVPLTIGKSGADGVDFIPVDGSSTNSSEWLETAMDVEDGHGVAPGSHIKYWLGSSNSWPVLEDVVDAAASDPSVHVVSNSWGASGDFSDAIMEATFQQAAASGTTFYFSTGDTPTLGYPSSSPYVVAVGGTTLSLDGTGAWSSETAWSASGTGCSHVFARPSWQTGVAGVATCAGRAVPDVSADADWNHSPAYVFFNGDGWLCGGTSLATPLWAGFTTDLNAARTAAGIGGVGFVAPLLYNLASAPATARRDFRDITAGSAGSNGARTGWDEATGWGTPILAGFAPPRIQSFSPAKGHVGTTVQLFGSGLTLATAVTFNATAASFTVGSDTEITAVIPAGTTTGPIRITTPNGAAVSVSSFAIIPTVTSFAPNAGPAGTVVTIRGSGFDGTTAVTIGGTAVDGYSVGSDTQITATVAAGTTTGPVSVTGPGGSAAGSALFYTPPTIGGFSPGGAGAHATVTVTGTSFTGATSVALNGTSVPFNVVSNTRLTFTVRTGATSGTIQVTAPGGNVTSAGSFTVLPPPTITSILPGSGPIGTLVTITGTNLTGTVGVMLGSVVTVPTSVSLTEVVFTIPPGASTGAIKILNPAGWATSPGTFTVTP